MIPRRRTIASVSVGWEDEAGNAYRVECSVTPSDPGRLYGPPEHCYPPEPAACEVLRVLDDTGKERPDLIAAVQKDFESIEEQAIENAEDRHAAAYEDACERRAEERREREWER
jgi:hypothetical protein